jgi:hypothetical protein
VQSACNTELQAALAGTVYNTGGCGSYYLDANGRNSFSWPWSTGRLRTQVARFDTRDFTVIHPTDQSSPPPAAWTGTGPCNRCGSLDGPHGGRCDGGTAHRDRTTPERGRLRGVCEGGMLEAAPVRGDAVLCCVAARTRSWYRHGQRARHDRSKEGCGTS